MIDINNEVYDNPWTFDGDIFTSGDIKEYYGFVYCITTVSYTHLRAHET